MLTERLLVETAELGSFPFEACVSDPSLIILVVLKVPLKAIHLIASVQIFLIDDSWASEGFKVYKIFGFKRTSGLELGVLRIKIQGILIYLLKYATVHEMRWLNGNNSRTRA